MFCNLQLFNNNHYSLVNSIVMFKLQQQKGTSLTIPLTVLAGAIVGSVAALLFAPKNGADFRAGIKSTAKDLKDKLGAITKGESKNKTDFPTYVQHKATMHPVKHDNIENVSKSAAMVHHLKQNKRADNQFPNPL
jgi:gas vesicle protein